MLDKGKFNILGINISAIDYEGAVQRIVDAANQGKGLSISALAVHGLMTGVTDRQHKYRLNQFDLLVPDGQPVRWALNWMYKTGLTDRVYGPNLMLKTCQRAAADGIPIFLFGGAPELLDALQSKLLQQFPTLKIAGMIPSRFRRLTPEERDDVVRQIRESGAKITFAGLGCPRQEVWAYEFRDRLSMPILAVGAAFNFHAGQLDQAPGFLQKRGLEWAYRLYKEPKRLWQRYLILNPYYLTLLFGQMTRFYRPNPDNCDPPHEEILYG